MNLLNLKELITEEDTNLIKKISLEYSDNFHLFGNGKGASIVDLLPTLKNIKYDYYNSKLFLPSTNFDHIVMKLKNSADNSISTYFSLTYKEKDYYLNIYTPIESSHIFIYYSKNEIVDPSSNSYITYDYHRDYYYNTSRELLISKNQQDKEKEIFKLFLTNYDRDFSYVSDIIKIMTDIELEKNILFKDLFSIVSKTLKKQNIKKNQF